MKPLDASHSAPSNGGPSFQLSNRLFRLTWNISWLLLAAWTPPPLHRWRRLILIAFGAKMGIRSDVRGTARVWYPPNLEMGDHALMAGKVDCYNQAPIHIGERTLISQKTYLCASSHDFDDVNFQLIARPIFIGANVWIAADAFVGPGTRINDRAVLGARAVAFGTLEADTVYAGNPAKPIRKRKFTE